MSQMLQTSDNLFQTPGEDQLRRYRRSATLLLVFMAAAFIVVLQIENPGFWVLLVRAGSEAALVGGLADWFAVTALFRRPLGLPIPHTEVVSRSKDRIGQGLGAFVEQHILDPDLVVERLREARLARRAGVWLSRPRNAAWAAAQISSVLPYVLREFDTDQVRDFFRRALSGRVQRLDLAPLLGLILDFLRRNDRHHELFDRLLRDARAYLSENEAQIYRIVERRSKWWVPRHIDRRVARALLRGITEFLTEMKQADHEVRRRFDAAVDRLIDDLQHSPDLSARISAVRDQVLGTPEVQAYLGSLWTEVKTVAESRSTSSDFRSALGDILRLFGVALARDRAAQASVDRWIEDFTRSTVSPFRAEIGRFIADVIQGWEARTISQRIERAVGRDLQYIRINGTVVGAIVGCSLFLVARYVF